MDVTAQEWIVFAIVGITALLMIRNVGRKKGRSDKKPKNFEV